MAWEKGPLPPATYGWGGVVPVDYDGDGFFFADFGGDTVKQIGGGGEGGERVLKAHEVKFYNNAIQDLPPGYKGRVTD
jgi:hypothetical protein